MGDYRKNDCRFISDGTSQASRPLYLYQSQLLTAEPLGR